MTKQGAALGAFTERLAKMIERDEHDPNFYIGVGSETALDQEGKVQFLPTGAEAILIVRGPLAGRRAALRKLLAQIDVS